MLVKFDLMMQEDVQCIKNEDIYDHYLGLKIQNEQIMLMVLQMNNHLFKGENAKYHITILTAPRTDTPHAVMLVHPLKKLQEQKILLTFFQFNTKLDNDCQNLLLSWKDLTFCHTSFRSTSILHVASTTKI